MSARTKKPRLIRLRFRKDDPSHNLLAAAQHYILANGGTALLIGGIDIITMPYDPPSKYRVAVGCLGVRPEKVKPPKPTVKAP